MNSLAIDTLYSARVDSLSSSAHTQGAQIELAFDKLDLMVYDSTFDYWGNGVNNKFSALKMTADSVRLMTSRSVYDAFTNEYDTWKSSLELFADSARLGVFTPYDSAWIALTATTIAQHADTLIMDGYVPSIVAGIVDADYINALNITADSINVGWLNAHVVVADTVITNWFSAHTITADKISGDTLTGVVINGVDIIGASFSTDDGATSMYNAVRVTSSGISMRSNGWGGNLTAGRGGVGTLSSLNIDCDLHVYGNILGAWAGDVIGDAYISSASTWNAKLDTSALSGYVTNATRLSDLEGLDADIAAKANAFTGYTGSFEVLLYDNSGMILTFSNGVLTSAVPD